MKKGTLFGSLSASELEHLTQGLAERRLPADAILIREGEPGDRAYLIVDGELEIIKSLGEQGERLMAVLGAGEFIGEMSLLNPDQPRTASARTRGPARLLEMTPADFDRLLRRNPVLMYEVARELSRRLRDSDNATIRDLREKNRQLTIAYEELKAAQAQIIEKEKLEHELDMARQIQESLLPHTLPPLAGFDFGVRMLPARAVGGDFYDFIPLGKDRLGLVVGDVCGKGVPSALVMAMTRSLLRPSAGRNRSALQVVRAVNHHLLDMNESGLFVTVLYGILDQPTRQFTYVRAAHETPLVFDASGALLPVPRGLGQPLGLFDEAEMEELTLAVPPGGTLILHSDGAPDALDRDDVAFGKERLAEAAQAHLDLPAQALCNRLLDILNTYRGTAPQHDDITLVVVKAGA